MPKQYKDVKEEEGKPRILGVEEFFFPFGWRRSIDEKETCEESGVKTKGTLMGVSIDFLFQSL